MPLYRRYAVHCPKEPAVELLQGTLPGGLSAHCCPQCQGAWINGDVYGSWQASQGVDPDPTEATIPITSAPSTFALQGEVPPLDSRAALCPTCRHYLVRGRIRLQDAAFFVERCPNCKGYWCDGGEWDILQRLGLHTHLNYVFQETWQAQVKVLEAFHREQQATVDKLGPEIAHKVFELADLLATHPNGDFGVAYLMRRFEE